jgi:hypothetical protein
VEKSLLCEDQPVSLPIIHRQFPSEETLSSRMLMVWV